MVGIPFDGYSDWANGRAAAAADAAKAAAPDDAMAPTTAAAIALNFLGDLSDGSDTRRSTDTSMIIGDDPWLDNAHRLRDSIDHMTNVLVREEAQYVDLYGSLRGGRGSGSGSGNAGTTNSSRIMTDEERNSLDASVASFAISTGNRIQALRRSLEDGGDDDGSNGTAHRLGIVACLVSSLRSDVVDRMAAMHAVRMRSSLDMARDPLRCRLPNQYGRRGGGAGHGVRSGGGADLGNAFDDVDGDEDVNDVALRDLLRDVHDAAVSSSAVDGGNAELPPSWKEAARAEEEEFNATYGQAGEEALLADLTSPPPSFPGVHDSPPSYDAVGEVNTDTFDQEGGDVPSTRLSRRIEPAASTRTSNPPPVYSPTAAPVDQAMLEYYGETTEEQEAYIEDLQRESAYLTASLQNELEDVHKIEGKMMEITTLLRQFGDLVSEQQEDIVAIHDQAERSKKNVQAGQDRLVDAGERKKKSKHYMATFIVCMALLLLFLNWITP